MPMKTDELRTVSLGVMPTPAEIEAASPTTDEIALHVARSRQQVEAILSGQDSRLLVIVGPCSIHDPEAAIDYAKRLHALQEKYRDQLFIVMRTYFEKPRTVVGWKGLVSDPHLDGSLDLVAGLHKARKLLVDVNALGMPTATEFLDMVTGQYLADLITWGAIGARTTESQIHREMASGLSCPVGFKNGTDGNIQIAIDAIRATRAPHVFCSPDKHGQMTIYRTSGNPYGHIILRGGKAPNYGEHDVTLSCQTLARFDLPQRLVIDFSHGNCQKQHKRQLDVAVNICQQIQSGSRAIAGIMAESFIVEGNQAVIAGKENELQYGCSITDPCLGWDDTATMIDMLADAVKATQN
ncbi:3-deoxy-7-phosphoheptulonate synthase [Photobacterium damselae]|uniref:3-deoxy-7-phosphoheptulonate synthase n=1 Tax=Photobacterium damselae TaxID=38293 RepID=UPI00083A2F26|nr:3-deoxy-7-phosphoheptulonate synthase [Photobacterium damselae]ODA26381.1 3-deoxy-7-phosphoheptulonate synthase [Photobacterium damselae subsp. damselae]TLS79074.1 3-deoxy-7-phosphoheptulonate synthase [Photobacterium damselae subsp. damselae]TLS86265.1 3-deoxy-7-phosphoheptulonate synthase [Photobacterium damselae subsp. damselae]